MAKRERQEDSCRLFVEVSTALRYPVIALGYCANKFSGMRVQNAQFSDWRSKRVPAGRPDKGVERIGALAGDFAMINVNPEVAMVIMFANGAVGLIIAKSGCTCPYSACTPKS